jgi:hypothetical protein
MNPTLAGLALIALGVARRKGEGKVVRFAPEAPSPKSRAEQRRAARATGTKGGRPHSHAFRIGGKRFVTKDTVQDNQNPNLHLHFLTVPIMVAGDRPGTRKRVAVRTATTLDPFGLRHTHKATVRGTTFESGGPL